MRFILKLFLPFVVVLAMASCNNQNNSQETKTNFEVDLTLIGAEPGDTIFMIERRDGEYVKLQSQILENGHGVYKGYVDYPAFYSFSYSALTPIVSFWVEPESKVTVKVDFKNVDHPEISGTSIQEYFNTFNDSITSIMDKGREYHLSFRRAMDRGDNELAMKFDSLRNKLDDLQHEYITDFVTDHSNSVIAPFILMHFLYQYELDELKPIVESFDSSLAGTSYFRTVDNWVSTLERVAVGQPFVDFEMNDTAGNPVKLSDIAKDKYLLIDFWAAWCTPCRMENPNVVNAYKTYHDKGFDVLGVSFDRKREDWLKAIKDDGLLWPQVSDLKGWENAAGKLYGVQSIPQNVLLSPDGIIIDKNLRGEDLLNKLRELLD